MRRLYLFYAVSAILFLAKISNINAGLCMSSPAKPIRRRLLTAEEGCGYSKELNTKIVGGAPARPGAFPWSALIATTSGGTLHFHCGGSLITSRHILTAAHCIDSGLAFIRLGEHDTATTTDGPHQDIKVIQTEIHPNYSELKDGDGTSDVAILTLERDVEFSDRIRPVCLPVQNEFQNMSLVGQNPFVAGWGLTEYNGKEMSNVLMQLQVQVLSNEVCELVHRLHLLVSPYEIKTTQFSDSVICAGNVIGGPGACSGDSGSALVLPILENGTFPMYQIGIVSWAIHHAKPFTPGVYARVTYFMDWIQETICPE